MATRRIDELDLVQIAIRQRHLIYVVLAMVCVNIASISLFYSGRNSPEFVVLGWVLLISLALVGMVTTVRLSLAMGTSVTVAVASVVILLLPVLGALVLLSFSNQATIILQLAGAKVGMMGVSPAERDKLRKGHCRGCGYNRVGLEVLAECPECGRTPVVW